MVPRRTIFCIIVVLVLVFHTSLSKPVEKEELNLLKNMMNSPSRLQNKNIRSLDSLTGMGLGRERSLHNEQAEILGDNLPPSRNLQYQTRSIDSLVGFGLGGDKRREANTYRSPKVIRGLDTLSGFTLGSAKKRQIDYDDYPSLSELFKKYYTIKSHRQGGEFDPIDGPGFGDFDKKSLDTIDMPGFGEFTKRSLDAIDMPGFGEFMKRDTNNLSEPNKKRSRRGFDETHMQELEDLNQRIA